jgi:hypothetical protein
MNFKKGLAIVTTGLALSALVASVPVNAQEALGTTVNAQGEVVKTSADWYKFCTSEVKPDVDSVWNACFSDPSGSQGDIPQCVAAYRVGLFQLRECLTVRLRHLRTGK